MSEINPGNISHFPTPSNLILPVTLQTSGVSISNLIGGLHLNLTQPECNSPVSDLPR
jgi:hypothetical protein